MTRRFTKKELSAINEALAFRLADEIEDVEDLDITWENYLSAKEKVEERLYG
jgi:hypothetical protein